MCQFTVNNYKANSSECKSILCKTQSHIEITVQVLTELEPQYTYELSASKDLPSDLSPYAVDHKINHKYPKLLNIPILNTAHSRVHIPKSTIFGTLKPVEIENGEISETSWTKSESLNKNTIENLEEIHQSSRNNTEFQLYNSIQAFSLNWVIVIDNQ